MENGEEAGSPQGLTLELDENERRFVGMTHARHLTCELAKCGTHALVHLILRLEAARRKADHDLDQAKNWNHHGVNGLCEKCTWTELDWARNLQADWGRR